MPAVSDVTLSLCSSCAPVEMDANRGAIETALTQAGLAAHVRLIPQACFNACGAPVSLSLQGVGRATYLFAGVDLQADLADIVATVKCYLDAPMGWIEDARACGRLRFCLRGRVPALTEG